MQKQIEDIKEKILKLAISGKLVKQDPKDESAEILYEKIQEEKEKLIKDKKIRRINLGEIKEEKIPFAIPNSWKWVKSNDVLDIRDGTHDTPKYVDKGIPLITSKNLIDGKINFQNTSKISISDHKKISERSYVEKDDLLMAMIGTIGKPVIVDIDTEFSIKNVALYKNYKRNMVNSKFIYYFLLYSEYDMNKEASGGVQKFMSLTKLRKYLLGLPPLNEQKRIVTKIDELFSLIDNMIQVKQDSLETIDLLEEKVLGLAIKGKLVEQDSSDEDAHMLFEKIQEQKENLIKDKKIRRVNLDEIKEEEIPFEIPNNWKWVKLGQISTINMRNKLDDDLKTSFISMTLIREGYEDKHDHEIKKWSEIKKGYTHFKEGDILLSKITPCFENKKSAIARNLKNGYGAGTTEVFAINTMGNVELSKLILYLFKMDSFIELGTDDFSGTAGHQRVGRNFIENLMIPLPPMNEQKRILKKLDIIKSSLNEMREKLNKNK